MDLPRFEVWFWWVVDWLVELCYTSVLLWYTDGKLTKLGQCASFSFFFLSIFFCFSLFFLVGFSA